MADFVCAGVGAAAGDGCVDVAGTHASPGACAIGTGAGAAAVAIFIGLTTIIAPPGAGGAAAAAIAGSAGFDGTAGATGCMAAIAAAGTGDVWASVVVRFDGEAATAVAGVENSGLIASDGGTGAFHGTVEARIIAGSASGVTDFAVASFVVTAGVAGTGGANAATCVTGGAVDGPTAGAARASVGRP